MHRIDTTSDREMWQFACPDRRRHRDWRVVDGLFQCRSCSATYEYLIDLETGERVYREEIELVGPGASEKGTFGKPNADD